jgi:hypothetical protein
MARTLPRKWIAKRIAELDAQKDYAEILKLSVVYRANDTFLDLIYSITFPNFVVPNHGALAVLREGRGKVYRHNERRMDDTARHILIWSEFGPDHEYTKRSVESLNSLHAFWATKYPESFSHNEDYLYTLCFEAVLFHRLSRRVGRKGLSEHEAIATWEFWRRMAKLFRNGSTGAPIEGFPDDFAACLEFVENYESKRRPPNQYAKQIDDLMIQAFSKRHLPRLLQPAGRTLILSLISEKTVINLGMRLPSAPIRAVCRFGFRVFLAVGEHLLPDPVVPFPELKREREGLTIEDYLRAATGGMKTQPNPAS